MAMEDKSYRTWKEFRQQEFSRFRTIQLSIDELAKDVYYEDIKDNGDEVEELNFD